MIEAIKWGTLGALLLVQLWALFRKKTLSRKQLTVKLVLNVLLWLVLLLFVVQPEWKSSESHKSVLVYSSATKKDKLKALQDSLKISKVVSYNEFKQKWSDFSDREIYLLGQDAEPEVLSNLAGKSVYWIPDLKELKEVNWEAVLRRSELQTVSGKIAVEEPSVLRIQYAGQTLDSVKLEKGFNAFDLKFPVFSEGRNEVSLVLEGMELQKIHFFATASPKFSVLMILDNPDFESKMLSEWLGRQSHKAKVLTEVAKSTLHQSDVNTSKRVFSHNLIITSPAKAGDSRVKKAVSEGKNVLFIGLTDAPSESQVINRSLGTQFSLKRISTEESVPVGKDLTALPFQFNPNPRQKTMKELPVTYQKKGGKVGVSLLNETFPLKLSGDSIQYNRVWTEMLALFLPSDSGAIHIQAPVFKDVSSEVIMNQYSKGFLYPNSDTLALSTSVVNIQQKSGNYIFRDAGWQELNDSLQVFVEDTNSEAYLKQWLKTNKSQSSTAGIETRTVPDWLWFVLILLCLAALWVEPKVRY